MDGGLISDAQEVANGGRDIDPGSLVFFIFRAFVTEDVLPVIGDEGATVFPLSVADFPSVGGVDLDPTAFTDGFSGFRDDALPPRDDAGGLGLM